MVDQSWDENGYIFQCIQAYEEEAQVTIPGLISIMQHKYGDEVVKNFTLDAIEQMKSATYNDKTGEVSSPMDAYIK